ncbi:hypothetical protein A3D08_01035 [Candidatus Roizmanbacteria bacterium RIFCSPHIGHO2_02_FULL_43_11]|uniref:DNA 3'-5' helicase n=1 Tax=Candidatus Roizmanbacteria bacterium RIFCSPHIGHO2_02_FULL_43_11 TaxID=1802043 RepID=A0A1F7HJH6_9BACT|nr:MAG: hypothetical protein A3D08_01035 [Candidatus Roizmanbacteria bacterium RIFCSPHIGHO2_02_FULL_43_11]
MTKSVFEDIFRQLNPIQRAAVETLDGPVMVVAGPGTGKTHVLAARIAHILSVTDTPPYAILALTFTESAAANMRKRVVSMIGKQGYYVNIMTFHAFCADVIRSHPEYFPIEQGSEPLSELEKYEVFQELLQTSNIRALRPINTPLFYLRDVISSISHLKREAIVPADFQKVIKHEFDAQDLKGTALKKLEIQKEKNSELLLLYQAYQKELKKRLRYDFDDMIAFVVEAFKKNDVLLMEYQEHKLYILVDEYQDTNTSQNTVVDLLASYWGQQANIFVVGDPNQSIFRFQGASTENTIGFLHAYPQAKIITLEAGFRSTQKIYDAAHAVIRENKLTQSENVGLLQEALTTRLKSNDGIGDHITIAALPSQTLEHVYIAEEIKRLLSKGILAENIAVVYRTNRESSDIQAVLEKWSIPYEVEGGENVLDAEMIRQLIQVMIVIRDVRKGAEDEKLFEIMSYDWLDIDAMLAMKIARAAGKAGVSIIDMIQGGYENFMKYYQRSDILQEDFSKAESFLTQLITWVQNDAKMAFTAWFEGFINESGYMNYVLSQENKIELLTNLNTLFREIRLLVDDKKNMKLSDFLKAIMTMAEHHLSLEAEDLNIEKGVVHLSTAHKAKGREWDYVFVTNVIDGVWGNSRSRDLIKLPAGLIKNVDISKKERNEDDRRLFYVALTRARKKVSLSYAKTINTNHRSREVAGSMFLEEIPENIKIVLEPQEYASHISDHLASILRPQNSKKLRVTDEDYFRDIISTFALSNTALNVYLKDTDEFIRTILLHVPRAKKPYMAFGTAVHKSLEHWNRALLQGHSYTQSQLIHDFEQALEKELLTREDFSRHRERGKEILVSYFQYYVKSQQKPLYIEHAFGRGFKKSIYGDIPLKGQIDRVELIDQSKNKVRIIDYKTGAIKSINDIEGKTVSVSISVRESELPESIRGPYKRQLLFYKLLAELDETFPYSVEEGVFDFIQPTASGKHVQRILTLQQADVEDLKKLIKTVMEEIRTLKFLTEPQA